MKGLHRSDMRIFQIAKSIAYTAGIFMESHLCVIGSEENGAEREVEIMYA